MNFMTLLKNFLPFFKFESLAEINSIYVEGRIDDSDGLISKFSLN